MIIHLVGAGGIGGWIIDLLNERFDNKDDIVIYLYDGDKVEEKNLKRQNFLPEDVGMHKVEALKLAYPNLHIIPVPKYIRHIPFKTNRTDEIVVCAIDKARERIAFSGQCAASGRIYIDVGNNVDDGQMVIEGIEDEVGLCAIYPDIIDKAYNDTFMSCATLSESSPQLLHVNFIGAELVVQTIIDLYYNITYITGLPVCNYEYNSLGDISITAKYQPQYEDGCLVVGKVLTNGLSEEQLGKIREIFEESMRS